MEIVLSDFPFQPGQVVEILVLAQASDRALVLSRLDQLLQSSDTPFTQSIQAPRD